MIKKWKATIRLAHGLHQVVFVHADTFQKASLLLELQFGKGRIAQAPVAVAIADERSSLQAHRSRLTEKLLSRLRSSLGN